MSPIIFLITIVPQCGPYSGSRPYPADEAPPMLTRLDAWPVYGMVCGPLTITGNVTDEAQTGVDPTGVAKIWVTLNGTEIADYTPRAECPVSVEFTFTNIEITETGPLALHADDCEGNEVILNRVIVDSVSDDVDPIPSFVFPADGETIYGTSWIFEAAVVSDNEDLNVCLEVDDFLIDCDESAPFKWLVAGLEEGPHMAFVTATDECGFYGEVEIQFNVSVEQNPEIQRYVPRKQEF